MQCSSPDFGTEKRSDIVRLERILHGLDEAHMLGPRPIMKKKVVCQWALGGGLFSISN